jgi:hypothetical protein
MKAGSDGAPFQSEHILNRQAAGEAWMLGLRYRIKYGRNGLASRKFSYRAILHDGGLKSRQMHCALRSNVHDTFQRNQALILAGQNSLNFRYRNSS